MNSRSIFVLDIHVHFNYQLLMYMQDRIPGMVVGGRSFKNLYLKCMFVEMTSLDAIVFSLKTLVNNIFKKGYCFFFFRFGLV